MPDLSQLDPLAVPLDEPDRIAALQQQLAMLDPNKRLESFDAFGLKNKSKKGSKVEINSLPSILDPGIRTPDKRTKGDTAKSVLSALFEGISAAGGGRNYKAPGERAREQYVEDYKLQAPRIIDELKILNQNSRAKSAQDARVESEQNRLATQVELANTRNKLTKYVAELRDGQATRANDIKQTLADLQVKYRGVKDPQALATLAELQTDFEGLSKNPEVAKQFRESQLQDKRGDYLAKALASRVGQQKTNITVPTFRTALDTQTGDTVGLPGSTTRSVTAPLNPQEQDAASKLFGPLFPAQSKPAQGQPNLQNLTPTPPAEDIVPQAALDQSRNSVSNKLLDPLAQKPKAAGNLAKAAAPVTTKPSDLAPKTGSDYDPEPLRTTRVSFPQDFNDSDLQNKIFRVQNTERGLETPYGTITDKDFRRLRQGSAKVKERFVTEQKATLDLNGLTMLGLKQYIRTGGKLMVGEQETKALEMAQKESPSAWGQLMGFMGRQLAPRKIDDIDRALKIMASKTFFDTVYSKTGMQANAFEFENTKNYALTPEIGPREFMFRALVLTLSANKNMDSEYRAIKSGQRQLPGNGSMPNLQWAVERAEKIMKRLDDLAKAPGTDRAKALQMMKFENLLNPNSQERGR